MAQRIFKAVNPKALVGILIRGVSEDTSGVDNVKVYVSDRRGNKYACGTYSGVAKDADLQVYANLTAIPSQNGKDFFVEVVANEGAANPVGVLPNDTVAELQLHVLNYVSIST